MPVNRNFICLFLCINIYFLSLFTYDHFSHYTYLSLCPCLFIRKFYISFCLSPILLTSHAVVVLTSRFIGTLVVFSAVPIIVAYASLKYLTKTPLTAAGFIVSVFVTSRWFFPTDGRSATDLLSPSPEINCDSILFPFVTKVDFVAVSRDFHINRIYQMKE